MEHAHVLESLDFALLLPGLQATRAKVLSFDFAVAERAEKPSAGIAGNNCFFLRMIKAARFAFDQDGFGVAALGDLTEKRRKDFDLQGCLAGGTGNHIRKIENGLEQPRFALRAIYFRSVHSRSHVREYNDSNHRWTRLNTEF